MRQTPPKALEILRVAASDSPYISCPINVQPPVDPENQTRSLGRSLAWGIQRCLSTCLLSPLFFPQTLNVFTFVDDVYYINILKETYPYMKFWYFNYSFVKYFFMIRVFCVANYIIKCSAICIGTPDCRSIVLATQNICTDLTSSESSLRLR